MKEPINTRELLINHYMSYPKLQIQDIFKFLYQGSFGCEHLLSSEDVALEYILCEMKGITDTHRWKVDALDGEYSRVHLSSLGGGMTPEILAKYFCLSAKTVPDGKEELIRKLTVTRDLIKEGYLPLSLCDFDEQHAKWKEAGYPAIHHSEAFRKAYNPSYRVISNEYVSILYKLFNT